MHISEFNNPQVTDLLAHDPDWHLARSKAIGGSDANIISRGDPAELERLRQMKCGEAEGEDLDNVLPVQMGSWTEPLNRLWLSRALKLDIVPGESCSHKDRPYLRASLDGVASDGGIVECKHVNAFTKEEEVVPKYMPQLQHNLFVTARPHVYISAFIGTFKHVWFKVLPDREYMAKLLAAEDAFWGYVMAGAPIFEAKSVETPIPASEMREEDMQGSNAWAVHAADWLMLQDEAKKFDAAAKGLKELVKPDVKRAFGSGIEITRAKNNALTIKSTKPSKEKK